MVSGGVVDFNRLPRVTRERFIESFGPHPRQAPLFAAPESQGGSLWVWTVLGLFGLLTFVGTAVMGFGQLGPATEAVQSAWLLPLYLGSAFLFTAAGLTLVWRRQQRAALPFPPGRYLFPRQFIDARSRHLRIVPLSELDDFKSVHERVNEAYSHTTFTFFFEDGERQTFVVRGVAEAERRLRELERLRETFGTQGDSEWLQADESTGPEGGPLVREPSRVLARRWLTALAVGMVLGAGTWLVRNLLSDRAAFATAKAEGLGSSYRDYLRTGWLHVEEAKELGWKAGFTDCELRNTERCWQDFVESWSGSSRFQEARTERLPRAALAEAFHSISALRQLRVNYPQSVVDAQARERIHELFAQAFADFQTQASTSNPELVPFMGKLLNHLEATGNPKVLVRFHRDAAALREADKLLGKVGKKKGSSIADASPHFTDARITPQEDYLVELLGYAFSQAFPSNVLVLEKGPALSAQQDTSGDTVPSLAIRYAAGWSGSAYDVSNDNRLFGGITFEANVDLGFPHEKPLHFTLTIKPPERIYIQSIRHISIQGQRVESSGKSTSELFYESIIRHAFGELGTKLRGTFFRPDSKAFLLGGGGRKGSGPEGAPSTASNSSP